MGDGNGICREEHAWVRCSQPSCTGASIAGGVCLAHLRQGARADVLQAVREGGVLDGRGVVFDGDLMRELSDALWPGDSRRVLSSPLFTDAIFQTSASFQGVRFEGVACFYKVRFEEEAMFDNAEFMGPAVFTGSQFMSDRSWATFYRARFLQEALFNGCHFHGETQFTEVAVTGTANFYGAMFDRKVSFTKSEFHRDVVFTETDFSGVVTFEEASFPSAPDFERAAFRSHVIFGQEGLSATALRFASVTFDRGVSLLAKSTDLIFDGCTFGGASIVAGLPGKKTRVLSVRATDVGNLLLSKMDLRPCRFAEAHNLDRLRFEATEPFASMPHGFQFGLCWPFIWRWTDRRAIAEELVWHNQHTAGLKWAGWGARENDMINAAPGEAALDPDDIARIYRALRKGREDNKDEAGASDYYYGEMEMRRKRRKGTMGLAETWVLFLFWLFSGYALRAGRALVSLVALVLLYSWLFETFGFSRSQPYFRGLLFSAETATNLLGGSVQQLPLNPTGDLLQVTLRILGPLLLGLAVLSLRGRIMR
jgi:uncharacterized protein YjbI with pentapeptide repeats